MRLRWTLAALARRPRRPGRPTRQREDGLKVGEKAPAFTRSRTRRARSGHSPISSRPARWRWSSTARRRGDRSARCSWFSCKPSRRISPPPASRWWASATTRWTSSRSSRRSGRSVPAAVGPGQQNDQGLRPVRRRGQGEAGGDPVPRHVRGGPGRGDPGQVVPRGPVQAAHAGGPDPGGEGSEVIRLATNNGRAPREPALTPFPGRCMSPEPARHLPVLAPRGHRPARPEAGRDLGRCHRRGRRAARGSSPSASGPRAA